jgi:hypothetical protein
MAGTRNWREVRGERTLNEARVAAFRRLMDGQQRIADALRPYGVSDAQLEAALAAAEAALPGDEHDERDFYPAALERYVASLGGKLELQATKLRAVFPKVTVTIDGPDDSAAT